MRAWSYSFRRCSPGRDIGPLAGTVTTRPRYRSSLTDCHAVPGGDAELTAREITDFLRYGRISTTQDECMERGVVGEQAGPALASQAVSPVLSGTFPLVAPWAGLEPAT